MDHTSWLQPVPILDFDIPQEPCSVIMTLQHRYFFMVRSEPANGFPRKPKESLKSTLVFITLMFFFFVCVYLYIWLYMITYVYEGNMSSETGGFSPPNVFQFLISIFTVQWFMKLGSWERTGPTEILAARICRHIINQTELRGCSYQRSGASSTLLIVIPANIDH